jgi:hypothetical protein
MRSWKKIITALIILALAAGSYGWYQYQKAPPDIRKESGVEVTAVELLKEFQQNETAANTKYKPIAAGRQRCSCKPTTWFQLLPAVFTKMMKALKK